MEWLRDVFLYLPAFCFSYPFIMSWYWMAGGLFYYLWRERGFNMPDDPPVLRAMASDLRPDPLLQ